VRVCGESKLSSTVAFWPEAKRSSAATCVGTVTSKISPAFGPEPIVRCSRALEPTALTETTGPSASTSVLV
jgi:hypothetical protein